ncbi:MAG: hypothetical protein EKK57_12435 [Proteobacteria bacterium]|nr:MAG: hypothetical protein EKK57_12435 [Pseudomonadota bacterium]
MKTIEQIFGAKKIVPTATIEDTDSALKTAEALLNAGINVMTIRILSQKSLRSLEKIAKEMPEMSVGAAGIMDAAGFFNSSLAGAKFISSPGITPELITAARTRYNDAHFLPGGVVPSHIMEILSRGLDVINLFPAVAFNGEELLDVYAHAFPNAKFSVVGGITFENMERYLVKKNVVAVGMSRICSRSLIETHNFAEITRLAKTAVDITNKILKI